MKPKEWFDQFEEFYLERTEWNNPQWCARHWAPCPMMGANGIAAAMEMITKFLEDNPGKSPTQLNEAMDGVTIPQCCQMGDEAIYKIWGRCPPSGMTSTQAGGDA